MLLIVIFVLYTGLFYYVFSVKIIWKKSAPFILILLASLLLSKGPMPPFGFLYEFMVNNIPLFSIIRSPDNKFGISVFFSLSMLLLYVLNYLRKHKAYWVTVSIALAIIGYNSVPLVTGEAVMGKDDYDKSGDYMISIPGEYREIAELLRETPTSNILIYPPRPAIFDYDKSLFIWRDILRIVAGKPFLSLINQTITNPNLSARLNDIYNEHDFQLLSGLNAQYVILRKDLYKRTGEFDIDVFRAEMEESNKFELKTNNRYLELYELKKEHFLPKLFLSGSDASVTFRRLSPVKYEIEIKNLDKDTTLHFLESFNRNFKLFIHPQQRSFTCESPFTYTIGQSLTKECGFDQQYVTAQDLLYPLEVPVFPDTQAVSYGYANEWHIDPERIKVNYAPDYYSENEDGSINVDLTLYFLPQTYFIYGVIVTVLTLVGCAVAYVWLRRKEKRNKANL